LEGHDDEEEQRKLPAMKVSENFTTITLRQAVQDSDNLLHAMHELLFR
jgi:hypothetical protein